MAIKITRKAEAAWEGSVEAGGGRIALGSGSFEGPYSLRARIEDVPQTNPEELLGAAHAGCFTMSLANLLDEAGHSPVRVQTTANVRMEEQPGGFSIARIVLETEGHVDGVDEATFLALAEQAKATCPISRALAGVADIQLEARLLEASA